MKVGIFLPEISPDRGGAYTFVETVVTGLVETNDRDTVVVFHYGTVGDLASQFDASRVTFHCLAESAAGRFAKKVWFQEVSSRLQKPLHLAASLLGKPLPYPAGSPLDHAVKQREIDLLWFPTPFAEHVDVPYIATVWDLEHRTHPYFPELGEHGEWRARDSYYADTLRRATYVVTGTEVGRDEIARFYTVDRERVRVLPHPTPTFAIEAAKQLAPPLALPIGTPYVLYPAQFWSHKNHIGLLDGIAELARRGTTVHCALVGSDKGNLAFVRAHAARLGIADRVHFLGFVERTDLVALYRHAAALAYTSLCGPENLPPLEAMALDCPVIASDFPGAREQMGDAALLVDTLDPRSLADAIERVLTSPELRRDLQARGRARAARYTQVEFCHDLEAIIDDFRRRRALWGRA